MFDKVSKKRGLTRAYINSKLMNIFASKFDKIILEVIIKILIVINLLFHHNTYIHTYFNSLRYNRKVHQLQEMLCIQ